jgi:hypothetical protein
MDKEQTTGQPKKKKIDPIMASVMIVTALCFDLLSLIPIVSILTTFTFTWMIMPTWFWLIGFNPFEKKRLGVNGVTSILEIIPVISMLPCLTMGLIANIIMINNENLAKII